MPHSSGGGSHGGGGHSGGGFSGGHGGGGVGPGYRTSHHYFGGSRAYVYYRHHRPIYIYSSGDLRHPQNGFSKLSAIYVSLFMLVFMFLLLIPICSLVMPPSALENTSAYEIVIEDRINKLGDTASLKSELTEFKNKTGITPAIITVYNETWKTNYSGLDKYAYDLYVNKFSDETHWLIVYSEPQVLEGEFTNWCWEGMQGDYTDNILSQNKVDMFCENLQKYLTASSFYTPNQAITKAFNELNERVMNSEIKEYTLTIFPLAILCLFEIVFVCIIVSTIKSTFFKGYKDEELQEIKT